MKPRSSSPILIAALLSTPVFGIGTLTFDADTEGFALAESAPETENVEWSSFNGGSVKVTVTGGWRDQVALKDIWNDPVLGPEIQLAATNGGTLRYTIYLEPDGFDITGGAYPNWFQLLQTSNSANAWDQEFNNSAIPGLGGGDFPLTEVRQIDIEIPIEPGAPEAVGGDGRLQLGAGTEYHELFIGLNSENSFTTATYYIDNLSVEANTVVDTTVPTMAISPATQGLTLIAAGNGQYERRMVRTYGAELLTSWVGQAAPGAPVNYRFHLADFPEITGFTAFVYLIPGTDLEELSDPDWQAPTAARLTAQYVSTDPLSVSADFSYKVDAPNSNGPAGNDYFTVDSVPSSGLGGILANLPASGMTGDWSVSFSSDTDFTITAPDGSSISGAMLQETADLFAGELYVYFGILPGTPENIGESAVISEISITGSEDEFSENFEYEDSEFLEPTPADRSGVRVATIETPYWLSWSLPATGYQLSESPDLGEGGGWLSLDMEPTITVNSKQRAHYLVNLFELFDDESGSNYFRLERPDLEVPPGE